MRTYSYSNNLSFSDGYSIIRLCQIGKDFAGKMQKIEARCVWGRMRRGFVPENTGDNYVGKWDRTRTDCRGIILRDNRILMSYETLTDYG